MRNSRILKLFSYIMLPIFVGILIISIFYIQVKDATYYDEEKYFESESFMSLYMTRLSDIARKLIYKNPEYKNIEEIKTYLSTFLDPSLFKNELKLSDINNPKQYDNYYEIDGELYCRNYIGKGWLSNYTGNYDIEIVSNTDNKIVVNIAYEYLTDDSKCDIKDLSKCSNSNFKYEISKINIEDGIIKKMDFHK